MNASQIVDNSQLTEFTKYRLDIWPFVEPLILCFKTKRALQSVEMFLSLVQITANYIFVSKYVTSLHALSVKFMRFMHTDNIRPAYLG